MTKINCILLVDDDDTTNFLNELLLKQLNIADKILIAKNGQEALTLFNQAGPETDPPALILLDIKMPIMNGFEFLEAFAKLEISRKESIRIVMLTTSLNPQDLEHLQRFKIAGLITKPLTAQNFQETAALIFGQPDSALHNETFEA